MPSAVDFRRAFGLDRGARIGGSSAVAAGRKRRRGAGDSSPPPQSFELTSVHVGHEVLSQNERYAFPTTLLLAPVAGAEASRSSRAAAASSASGCSAHDAAAAALREALHGQHIVYSAYGSPYECAFELATLKLHRAEAASSATAADGGNVPPGTWHATARGIARRRRDMPTKAQLAQQRGAGGGDDKAAKRAAKEERARVRAEAKARGLRVVVSRFGSGVCASCGGAVEHGQLIARPAAADAADRRGSWAHAACALLPRTPRRARA